MRRHIAIAFTFLSTMAHAGNIPVQGPSTLSSLEPHSDFALTRIHRLRSTDAGLSFIAPDPQARFPHLRLASPQGCELRIEDRNFDGRWDTEQASIDGRPVARCPKDRTAFKHSMVESGSDAPRITNCLFHTTDALDVVCQPTRFGRAEGEAWPVLQGFADSWGRMALGRPDSLMWHEDGLLVLDGTAGAIYRLDWNPKPEDTLVEAGEPEYWPGLPKKPELPSGSSLEELRTGGDRLPVSKERQKLLDDREARYGENGRTVTIGSE